MRRRRTLCSFSGPGDIMDGVAAVNAAEDAAGVATALAAHGKKLDL